MRHLKDGSSLIPSSIPPSLPCKLELEIPAAKAGKRDLISTLKTWLSPQRLLGNSSLYKLSDDLAGFTAESKTEGVRGSIFLVMCSSRTFTLYVCLIMLSDY